MKARSRTTSGAALEAAVARNVFGVSEPPLGAARLATYMREASRRLAAQLPDALVAHR